MNTERLREQLKYDEGVKYEIYLDHLGYPTCGIGHLILEGEAEHGKAVGTKVSEERVNELFEKDLSVTVSECKKLYNNFSSLPEEVQEILVNMVFNLGRPRLSKFKKFNAAIAKNDWRTAALEGRDSVWYRQVTNRAERLMKRLEKV